MSPSRRVKNAGINIKKPNVVQFKSPAKHGRLTISSWKRRALEDERSCRRVYVRAVRLMRAAVACMYITYVCSRPTKAAAGLARRVSRFPQRHAANRSRSSTDNGSCRIGISVDMGVSTVSGTRRRGLVALICCDRSLWKRLSRRYASADDVGLSFLPFRIAHSATNNIVACNSSAMHTVLTAHTWPRNTG